MEAASLLHTSRLHHAQPQENLLATLDAHCNRVDAVDPIIRAVLPEAGRRERLHADAAALDEGTATPGTLPLYGVLVGVKDIISVDGFPTRAGSRLPAHLFDTPEASCVARLRAAGALILGKTVTTEFAYFEPGPTRNPHNTAHTPGGSSSGSAAAVAAGFCPLALGTQTIGSIIRPAAFCGIVGFKPTFGRIPTDGIVLFSPSADHVGLFAQGVADIRVAAAVLCNDWGEPVQNGSRPLPVLGVPKGAYLDQASEEALAAFERQLNKLRAGGYTVRRVPALDDIHDVNRQHRTMIAADVARIHATWFDEYEPLYSEHMAAIVREGQRVNADTLKAARASRDTVRARLDSIRADAGIDLWMTPAAPGPAPEGLATTGDPAMNLPWTYTGLPALTLPAARAQNGLPLGLQIVAGAMQDEQLLAWALHLENAIARE